MTAAEYVALAAACDALLCGPAVTQERMGIPWLHVRSEHPNNLDQYKWVFDCPEPFVRVKRDLRRFAGIAKPLVRSLFRPVNASADWSNEFPDKVDFLLISHLVSLQADPDGPDFYYGRLPEELAAHGLKSLVALHYQVRHYDEKVVKRFTRGGVTSRIVLPRWTTFHQEADFLRRARLAARALLREAVAQTPLQERISREASFQAGTASTIASLRLHDGVKQLCARFRPRALVVTWEGHAWERMAFHAARTVDPSVRCVGYQHTILFAQSHALRRSLGKSYDPDAILTLGDVTRDELRLSNGLRGIPIMTYGSHRRPVAAVPHAPDALTRCLVIPEGLEMECLTLIDFAVAAAVRMPFIQFVLRMHPVLPFALLTRRHPRLRSLPENVRVSDEIDINADFARCYWAIYRGSSAAVHAVLAGVRPVYVERPGEMAIDPLFMLEGWRRHVATVEGLEAVIATDRSATPDNVRGEWEPARAFCDRYVVPPNSETLAGLVTN